MCDNQIVESNLELHRPRPGAGFLAKLFGVLLGLACTVGSGGAALGAWSGETALVGLIAVALLAGFYLLLLRQPRVSSAYALALGLGLIGLAMCALGVSQAIVIPGGLLCGLMSWALGRIVRKGWLYAR
jgi:hypothetical protein